MSVNQWTKKWAESKGIRCRYYRETESTNSHAKDEFLRDSNVELSIYLADHQTQGRGRGENSWLDGGNGQCFLASLSYKPVAPPQPIITALIGLAVYKSLIEIWPKLKWSLKAPNDILLDGKKLAGILVETVQQGAEIRTIVGLGINITNAPEGIDQEHTSLAHEAKPEDVSENLWHQFIESLQWNLKIAIEDGQLNHLAASACDELKVALNKNPNLLDKVEKVQLDGSLDFPGKTLPWHKV